MGNFLLLLKKYQSFELAKASPLGFSNLLVDIYWSIVKHTVRNFRLDGAVSVLAMITIHMDSMVDVFTAVHSLLVLIVEVWNFKVFLSC